MIWIKIIVLILGFAITIISITYDDSKNRHVIIAIIGVLFIVLSALDIYKTEKDKMTVSLEDLNFAFYLTGKEKPSSGHAFDHVFSLLKDGTNTPFSKHMSFIGTISDSIKFKVELECISTTTIDFKIAEETENNESYILKESCFIQRNIHYMKDTKGILTNITDLKDAIIKFDNTSYIYHPEDWVLSGRLYVKNKPFDAEIERRKIHIFPEARSFNIQYTLDSL